MRAEPTDTARHPRPRPVVHFTAPAGWINDPHAVAHLNGRYHLFYQHNPEGTEWSPHCHWGHATSSRLVGWTDHGDALSPDDGDIGVWSGAIAVDDDQAVLFYTSIRSANWAEGAISIAVGSADRMCWTKDSRNPVIAGPPPGLDTLAFRDPYLWRDADGWSMIVGTGIRGVGGAIARYTSPNVTDWTLQGLITLAGANPDDQGVYTGDLWECPQLFELDGSSVLMFSVQDQHQDLHDVVYAVGTFDGSTFDVRRWGQFGHGPSPYATTTFTDAAGDRVAISWLRERPDAVVDTFAGAHSLPVRLSLVDDRLVATPHSDVLAMRRTITAPLDEATAPPTAITMTADLVQDAAIRVLDGSSGETLVEVSTACSGTGIVVSAAGAESISVPAVSTRVELSVVIDADIVEICSPQIEGFVGLRLPAAPASVIATAGAGAARRDALSPIARLSRLWPGCSATWNCVPRSCSEVVREPALATRRAVPSSTGTGRHEHPTRSEEAPSS